MDQVLPQKTIAAALGLSPAQVTRDKARGMPVADGVEACRRWRAENIRGRVVVGAQAAGAPRRALEAEPSGGYVDYGTERARREAAEASLAELRLMEQRGELVRAADVRAAESRRVAALRDAMLQIPARLAPIVAAESDMARCHAAIEGELHSVLELVAGGR